MDEEKDLPEEQTEEPAEEPEAQNKGVSSDLIRGHINTIILRSLYDGDKYGYEIIAEIERKSHGQYELKQPSLYSALKRLEKDGYITSYWGGSVGGGRRKYFSLTDSGKEIAEQNQSEWEYSRTIIDSLISDKDFDFNNPAPSAVNMRVLRRTTSRVPTQGGEEEEFEFEPAFDDTEERDRLAAEYEQKTAELNEEREKLEAEMKEREEALRAEEAQRREEYEAKRAAEEEEYAARTRVLEEERAYIESVRTRNEEEEAARTAREEELRRSESMLREENAQNAAALEEERRIHAAALEEERRLRSEALAEQEVRIREEMEEEFRRREQSLLYQNYINLVNTPPAPTPEAPYYVAPEEPKAEPEPEEERDYRAVLGKLYSGAVPKEPDRRETAERAQSLGGIDFADLEARAAKDGIRITTSGKQARGEREEAEIVHKGKALFLSSVVAFFYCVVLGGIVLGIRNTYGIALFHPVFIWCVGLALLLVTGLAYANRFGERALRRRSLAAVNAVVIYTLLVIVTLIVALGVKIDFADSADLANFVIIPIVFLFFVVLFGITYYLQVREHKKK